VSTGSGTSVLQIAMYLNATSRVMKQPEFREAREGDVPASALDPAKARAALEWQAVQPIENGLAFTWRWMCANLS
jgi:UDP-glucose 4-epimerase